MVFLNGELNEEIFMLQPDGYVIPGKEHLVCKFRVDWFSAEYSRSMFVYSST